MRRLPLRSPPRMRGKAPADTIRTQFIGITPAYAGKSQRTAFPVAGGQDHPRVCGEKCPNCGRKMKQQGSPPRMRGKVRHAAAGDQTERITPAYAGKRACQSQDRQKTWDHPRMCGEKSAASFSCRVGRGSPPHVRGKAAEGLAGFQHTGITPAYAGKSRSARRSAHRSGITPAYAGKSLIAPGS